jgi:hypothetical protein
MCLVYATRLHQMHFLLSGLLLATTVFSLPIHCATPMICFQAFSPNQATTFAWWDIVVHLAPTKLQHRSSRSTSCSIMCWNVSMMRSSPPQFIRLVLRPSFSHMESVLGSVGMPKTFFVNLLLNTGNNYNVLQFLDGTSSQRAGEVTLLACPGNETNKDTCCSGGALFLKVNFGGASSGVVYLNYALVPDVGCRTSMSIPGAEMGWSTELCFIDCNDDCLLDPFDDVACTSSLGSVEVIQGQALCFGV